MATHSSILVWRIPGMEEPGGLLSVGSHRTRHDWSDLAAAYNWGESDRRRCLKVWDSFLMRHSFFFVCRVLFAKFPCKFLKTPKILKIKKNLVIQEPLYPTHKPALLVILCWSLNDKEYPCLSGCLLLPRFLSYKPWSQSRFLHLSFSPVPASSHSQSPSGVSLEHPVPLTSSQVLITALVVGLGICLFLDYWLTIAALLASHLWSQLFQPTKDAPSLFKILTDYRIK